MNPSILLAVLLLGRPALAGDPAPPAPTDAPADAPFNLKTATPEMRARIAQLRDPLQLYGYRFGDDGETILSPRTQKPAGRREIESVVQSLKRGRMFNALERVAAFLKDQDAGKPIPPAALAQIKAIVAADKDVLPPALVRAVEAAGAGPAGSLGSDALAAYADATRLFDGGATLGSRLAGAVPVKGGGWDAKPPFPAYVTPVERDLGDKIKAAVAAHFAGFDTGKELLSRFTDDKGVLTLPDMLVLDIDPAAAAGYQTQNRSIVCSFAPLRDAVVADLAGDDFEKQNALMRQLSSPAALDDFLAKNPRAVDAFARVYDVSLYHELTHAWQDKRSALMVEQRLGNLSGDDAIEQEWDAFLNQTRFIHEKMMKDPEAAMRSSSAGDYLMLLSNYDSFLDDVSRRYLQSQVAGSADLPTMKQIQDLRRKTELGTLGGGWEERLKGLLKILGLRQGDAALDQAQTDYQLRREAFVKNDLPRIRVEGNLAVSAYYEKHREYEAAFRSVVAAEGFAKGTPREAEATGRAQALSDKAYAWVEKGRGDPDNMAAAIAAVADRSFALRRRLPDDYNDLLVKTYLRAFDAHLDASRRSRVPEIQKRERTWAQAYVDGLKNIGDAAVTDPALLRRLRAARALFPTGAPEPAPAGGPR